jgi:hypothetical protein
VAEDDQLAEFPAFLSETELAVRYKRSRRNLAQWREKGYGPAWCYLAGRVIYPVTGVEKFEAQLFDQAGRSSA